MINDIIMLIATILFFMNNLKLFLKEGKFNKDLIIFLVFFFLFMFTLIISGTLNLFYGSKDFGAGLLIGGSGLLFCFVFFSIKWFLANREFKEKIEVIVKQDKLTGLMNSITYREKMKDVVINKNKENLLFCATLGIDRFKHINQSLGYQLGDEIIILFSHKLKKILKNNDILSRINGDEFSILLKLKNEEELEDVLNYIKLLTNDKYILSNNQIVNISISIGGYISDKEEEAEEILKKSQIAMTYSKKNGGNQFNIYKNEMESKNIADLEMENELREAIPNNELVVHYQPKYSAITGEIIGAEALVRWFNVKKNKLIPPMQFIKVAEDIGIIGDIGKFVLKSACEEIEYWREHGKDIKISVNVSTKQFKEEDLFHEIKNIIECYDIPHSNIELEITESLVMENVEYGIKTLQDLKNLGIRISIDDFGTGYSSLSYLKLIPANTIKIDRLFVNNMENNEKDLAIVKTIISLSHNLNCDVVAEGVETESQYEILKNIDCDYIQGYYFSKPLGREEFRKLK